MTTTFDFGYGPVPAHRHKNGGGWVADTALVEDTAYVGPSARVSDTAQVFGNAQVGPNACISGDAHVYGNPHVYGNARVTSEFIKGFTPKSPIPVLPDLDTKILTAINQEGCSLDMSRWHACKTTHCRAGWAIHLGGEAGYALEKEVGPWLAGALIYQASTGRIPDFYASAKDTLKDLSKGLKCHESQKVV